MKPSYATPFARLITLVAAPLIYVTRLRQARRAYAKMIELGRIVREPRGRIDAPHLVSEILADARFFGIPPSLAGYDSFDNLLAAAYEAKGRHLRQLKTEKNSKIESTRPRH